MRNYQLATLLGLTTTLTLGVHSSVQAATLNYDYNQLSFISSRPIESNHVLNFYGDTSDNQGFAPFYNLDSSALDHGHREIGLNSRKDAPINNAPYYGTGRQGSPEQPASGATRTATLTESTSFSSFSNYLTNNGIPLSNIGFVFGQKSDRSFTQTWNLGSDTRGVDWSASPDSPREERIYKANPNDVEIALVDGTNKILDLGYSNFYSVEDYGSSPSPNDDFEGNFTDILKPTEVSGLDALDKGLADAFLKDVTTDGGGIQFVNENYGVLDVDLAQGNGYGIFRLPFPIELRAVPLKAVPEPSSVLEILMFGALVAVFRLKRQKTNRVSST